MFEFTAPHIGDALVQRLAGKERRFGITLDKGEIIGGTGMKAKDRPEQTHLAMLRQAMGGRLRPAYALTDGAGQTFETHYHIKVAVRDRTDVWLSSGSWQSSNQPPLAPLNGDAEDPRVPTCNREWHVIIQHKGFAETMRAFLLWDLETAERVGPSTDTTVLTRGPFEGASLPDVFVDQRDGFPYERFFADEEFSFAGGDTYQLTPLLTPDNYIDAMTALVDEARDELLVQNQNLAFRQVEDPRFTAFVSVLARKSQDMRDFRLILRNPEEFNDSRPAKLQLLKDRGINTDRVRFQTKGHNKGIVVDRHHVVIGSHNYTSAGTTSNRDASVIVTHEGVAEYYRKIFEHDWDVAGRAPSLLPPRVALPGEPTPPGMKRIRFAEAFEDD